MKRPWQPWVILGAVLLVSSAVAFWAGRDTVFRGDDWDLLLFRGGVSWNVFLAPHNEHLSALLVAAFKAIPTIAGPHYAAFRAALLALDVAVAALFFVFARERVGDWLALFATAPLLLMGAGSDNLLWPTQIGVVASLACGIGSLILLDRENLAARAGACALLTTSISGFERRASSLLCAAIWLVLSRNRWRQMWVVLVPAITYIAWYTGHGTSDVSRDDLHAAPHFVAELAAAGVSALTGFGFTSGHPKAVGLAVGLALLAGLAAFAIRVRPQVTPRMVALVSLPIRSLDVDRAGRRAAGGDPYASRYAYGSAVFILMAVLEIVRGDYAKQLFGGWRIAIVALAVGFSVFFNVKLLFEAGDYWRGVSQSIRGRTAAVELTRRTVDPGSLVLEPLQDMAHMTPGWFLNAVGKYGQSPTGSDRSRRARRRGPRRRGSGARGRSARPVRATTAGRPAHGSDAAPGHSLDEGAHAGLVPDGSQRRNPQRRGTALGGILIRPRGGQNAKVMLRRFSSDFVNAPEHTISGSTLLVIAADHSSVPWHVRVSARVPISVCGHRHPVAFAADR